MINTELNVSTKKEKPNATFHQKTFDQLIKTVQDLHNQQETTNRDLDLALQFYHETMRPHESVLLQVLMERFTIAYQCYRTSKNFSKHELKAFKEWLTQEVNQVCVMHNSLKVPAEIQKIFKELHGISYEESLAEQLNTLKKAIKEQFGMDIDISDIDLQDSHEEIMRNIFLKMGKATASKKDSSCKAPQSKKQREKELKKQAFEEIQSKSLSSIYKQLVRVLHPDLEQNIEKKVWKEELMKKLTTSYKGNDLYSLLTIEMEWANRSAGKIQSQNDEDLKIYNTILKDQINELQTAIDTLFMHPKFMPIQGLYNNKFDGISTLKNKTVELKKSIQEIQGMIPLLKTSESQTIFKKIIQERIAMQRLTTQKFMPF
ncbi:MAG: hypothetical protein NTX86_02235 [Candidatus Dependentiae bacterium]|nr:hypothetical protein [Candidatus Dependentiae bacterium]